MSLLKKVKARWLKWSERKLDIQIEPFVDGFERPGTGYGGWIVPRNLLEKTSVVYLVGAGVDISFDVAVAEKTGCRVHIFDPTPRAKQHFDDLIFKTQNGQKMQLTGSLSGFYEVEKATIALLHFHQIGIWSEDKTERFFAPPEADHVSHSIVNLHGTSTFFDAEVRRLSTVMAELGHSEIDLLKIDIEGAEYEVIQSIVAEKIAVRCLCIEFDENHRHHLDEKYIDRIESALKSLESVGFRVVARESDCYNFTLLRF